MARSLSLGSGRPASEWLNVLRKAESAEERYRALTQIMLSGSVAEAVAASRDSLDDTDPIVRSLAARQLGKLKHKPASDDSGLDWDAIASKLQTLLASDDIDVRFEAACALSGINPSATSARDILLELLAKGEAMPLMLAALLAALTERSDVSPETLVEHYRQLLSNTQADVRENVAIAVAKWGESARSLVDQLVLAIDDAEPVVRENAAIALGGCGIKTEAITKALESAAADDDEGVANAASSALKRLED